MAKRIVTYETLVEDAADSPDAWRKLQAVHAMKARGGTPEIRWNRRDGYSVIDISDRDARENQRLAG